MSNGITEKMRELAKSVREREIKPFEKQTRNRSLNGKARIKERKAENKESRS